MSVAISPREAPACLSCILEGVEVCPAQLMGRLCPEGGAAVLRTPPRLRQILEDMSQPPPSMPRGYLKVKLLELLLHLAALPPEALSAPQGCTAAQVRLAQQAYRLLQEAGEHPPTLAALARQAGVSPCRLRRSFCAFYGMTPAACLRSVRMQQAACLLRQTERTVADIAAEVGYDNASKFARAFRKEMGLSPGVYRCAAPPCGCPCADAGPAPPPGTAPAAG